MKKTLFFFMSMLVSISLLSQTNIVSGTIKDQQGEPIIGASIIETNTSNGTTSDLNGQFSIKVQPNTNLTITYVGFKTQVIEVEKQQTINIIMFEDAALLEELVVVGYGLQKRSTMTSSVASISSKETSKQISSNIAGALQGRAAGVDVVQTAGIAGADVKIVIRGAASLTSTEPLYVIDGVFSNGGLSSLNIADVESIEILKDGSSAAIYGSRAANGVVLITTKGGKKGSTVISLNSSYSIQKVTNVPDFLNADEWRNFANTVAENSGLAPAPENVNPTNPAVNTDWAKEWLQYAPVYSIDTNLSGGSEYGVFNSSLGYFDQTGLTLNSGFKRYNARLNSSFNKGILFFSNNVSVVFRDRKPTASFNIAQPNLPLTDEYGRYSSWGTDYYIETENARKNHPFAGLYAVNQHTRTFDVMGGFNAGVNIVEGVKLTTSFSGNYTSNHGYTHSPVYYAKWNDDGSPDSDYGNSKNSLSESRGVLSNYTWDNIINFDKTFNKHTFNAILGHSWMREFYRTQSYTTINDLGDKNIVGFSGIDGKISASERNFALLSFFTRINYDYDERYLLSFSVRRDESSKFHKDNRVGYFPAISGGWNIYKEEWFKNDIVSMLKLTGSYGELGANFLEPYNFDNIAFGPIPYTVAGVRFIDGRAAYLKSKNLKWETSKSTNLGIEVGLFENELKFIANYFHKKNVDLLATINLNLSSGQIFEINTSRETPYVNTASVENKGYEFMLIYRKQITKDLGMEVTGNVSTLNNRVLALGDNVQPITAGSYASSFNDAASITTPGYAIGSFYGYKIDGFDNNGNFAFNDRDGDGQITAKDKYILGDPIPDFSYGLNLNVDYKNVDFTLFFNGVQGNKIFNAMKYQYYFNYSNNLVSEVLKSWTPNNPSTTVPIAKVTNGQGGNSLPSEFYIEDGSYLRLKNIQIGYTLPKRISRNIFIENMRVYAGIQNAFTITKYSGYDPEVSSNVLFSRGIDLNSYPNAKIYSAGINLTF